MTGSADNVRSTDDYKRSPIVRYNVRIMRRTLVARAVCGILLSAGCWIAYTQTQKTPPKLTISKVKDDLYNIEGDGGNVAAYVTSEGVILVDDKFEQDHEQIVERVKSVSDKPVKY